ncbi:glutathione S-transferase [Frigidibacter oleivorans]|uniref:glutathione S-transferase n=1 Tax=Frigidibacter oleivorans TaxID=2487129 RepID=UPI000F8E0E05|nr:glutathione S-transferase [Frigidibacter oleivorans]
MSYELAIGDRTYSSWSLRGWLMFEAFGIPVRVRRARLYSDEVPRLLADFAPARLVPAMRTPEGIAVGETLAIAETLAERHPEAGMWPADPAARAFARWLSAEMHAGFAALRDHCTMHLGKSYTDCAPPPAVLADVARIEALWAEARQRFGAGGPWLFGAYSIADAMYAPVAGRIATYNLPVGAGAAAYVAAHLADPAFRRWRAMGLAENFEQPVYRRDYPERPWPGPAPRPADRAEGPSENVACPYSGDPVTHYLRMDGRVWGFCNAFCRDKTLHDPEAWPAFMAMVGAAALLSTVPPAPAR